VPEAREVIVPARALIELARSLASSTCPVAVTLTPSEAQIVFHTDNLELVSRLIDGKYPDVTRIIPRDCVTRAVLDRQAVARALKLAACFAPAATNVVKLDLAPGAEHAAGTLTISANAAEVGDYQAVREGAIAGAGGQILLNVAYVADAIHAIATPQLALEIQTPQHPTVFKPVGVDDFVSVIMPMNVR
jgi:DNA polymerase-3 subunit beta